MISQEGVHPSVYIFGWPSYIGGADTKLVHLLLLLHRDCNITLIPNDKQRLRESQWTRFLQSLRIRFLSAESLPTCMSGCALALSNSRFFTDRIAHRAKDRGLKIIWSSEMMWHHPGELEAVHDRVIDHVLYVSEFQRTALEPGYRSVNGSITGNYIAHDAFPFSERRNETFTIGRLSRPGPEKYPEDFPVFYEALGLPDVRFRIMAWSDELERKYRWHRWDSRWEKLAAATEPTAEFLKTLDLFIYPLGHNVRESWGRSTVEAMLSGAVTIVPKGHQFEALMVHGESGFVCGDFSEWRDCAHHLRRDIDFRRKIAHQAREHAVRHLCNPEVHRRLWLDMFHKVLTN